MKSVDDYLTELLAFQPRLEPVSLPLAEALNCVTAEPVTTLHPIPLFDNSSMDGYVLYRSDIEGAAPTSVVTLPVIGDIPAGITHQTDVPPRHAARIMTGAPMPTGADHIVPVEETDAGVTEVKIMGTGGEFVRPRGGDVPAGEEIIPAGTRLSARHLASAASAGHGHLLVFPKPRVAVVSTGTELRAPGESLEFGQIPNSNSILIASTLEGEAQAIDLGSVPDDPDSLKEALDSVAADAVILTGGVSVGAYDVVKELLSTEPGMWFGPVSMQPGKPQGYGSYRGMSVFTLPGNPVSVYVTLHMLVRPALSHMCGLEDVAPRFVPALADENWGCPPGRTQFIPVRATVGDDGVPRVAPASSGGSGSHLIGTLAHAHGLARVESNVETVTNGDHVLFWEER